MGDYGENYHLMEATSTDKVIFKTTKKAQKGGLITI